MENSQTTQSNTSQGADYFGSSATPMVTGYDLTRYQYFLSSPFFAGFDDFQNPKRKLFLEEFRQMSSNLRTFLTSVETAKVIFTTSQENNLEEGQIYQTAELFRDLVSGKIFIKDLSVTLAQKINIDNSKASTLINKVVSKSFGPIIEDVKRIQRSKFPDKISQIQKESQPAGLTQPTARPLPPRPEAGLPKPPEVQLPKPEVQPQGPQAMRPPEVRLPPTPQPAKPKLEFKVPDLSGIRIPPSSPSGQAGESLEKELEKVASIIDLRNKPKE